MMRTTRSRRGDTIVEVMISIAVVGAVLGGAYYSLHKTMQNNQSAQEHTQALGYAQAQIEALTGRATDDASKIYTAGAQVFCYDPAGTGTFYAFPGLTTVSDSTGFSSGNWPAQCKNIGVASRYRVAVQYTPAGTSTYPNFTVYVFWPSATGHGDDQVMLHYQLPNPTRYLQ